ncbi:unnamed protein product [Chrysoparadoxa australica]
MQSSERRGSHVISSLVGQLKAGQLTKAELFAELTKLQHNDVDETPPELDDKPFIGSGFTGEDRRTIIRRLVEEQKKKKSSQSQPSQLAHPSPPSPPPGNYVEPEQAVYPPEDDEPQPHEYIDYDEVATYGYYGGRDYEEQGPYLSESRGAGAQNCNYRTVDHKAYEFRSFSEERARRAEEVVREELMAECTFKPRIKPLPQSYGAPKNGNTPFLARVTQWQRDCHEQVTRKRFDGDDQELAGCTFSPTINKSSRRAATLRRQEAGDFDVPMHERLYEAGLLKTAERARLAAEAKAREEATLAQECTFKPRTSGSHGKHTRAKPRGDDKVSFAHISLAFPSSYKEAASNYSRWGSRKKPCAVEYHANADCTFTPQIIGVLDDMESAKLYLQYDVVARLTGEAFLEDQDTKEPEEDTLTTGNASKGGGSGLALKLITSVPHEGDAYNAVTYLEGLTERLGEASVGHEGSKSFQDFLERQNQGEIRRRKHVEELQNRAQPTFKPNLCRTAESMNTSKGTFLQRLARDAIRKEHETLRQRASRKDPNCTFRPKLTKKSEQLPARSMVELSRGDQLKRETMQRLNKLRSEQEQMQGVTFNPQLNDNAMARNAESRLKVVSDPDSYLASVKMEAKKRQDRCKEGTVQRELAEVEGCTFTPQTKPCPAYIRRIAQSLAKSKTPSEQNSCRPEWK